MYILRIAEIVYKSRLLFLAGTVHTLVTLLVVEVRGWQDLYIFTQCTYTCSYKKNIIYMNRLTDSVQDTHNLLY